MAFWNSKVKNGIPKKYDVNTDEEEDEGEGQGEMDFEDSVLEKLSAISRTLEKLTKRIDAMEEQEKTRIDRLEFDLRRKSDYVENLLAKLLDKDYVLGTIGKSSSNSAIQSSNKYNNGPIVPEKIKLTGPNPAKLPG